MSRKISIAFSVCVLAIASAGAQDGRICYQTGGTSDEQVYAVDPSTRQQTPVAAGHLTDSFDSGVVVRQSDGITLFSASGASITPSFPEKSLGHRWSPSGDRVINRHSADLYVAKSDGSDARMVVGPVQKAWWSPADDGTVFLQVSRIGTGGSNLASVDVESGEVRTILESFSLSGTDPFSPDGSRLLVANCEDGFNCLSVYDQETGEISALGPRSPAGFGRPLRSPDGQQILATEGEGVGGLHILDAMTGASTELVSGRSEWAPIGTSWSPDGTWVVFQIEDFTSSSTPKIAITRSDGSGEPEIIAEGRWARWVSAEGRTAVGRITWGKLKQHVDGR